MQKNFRSIIAFIGFNHLFLPMNFIKPNWFELSLIFLLTFLKIGQLRFLWNILISWILHFNISFKRLKRTKIVEIVEPVFRASSRVPNLLRPKIGNTRTIPQTGRTFHGVSRPLTTPFYVAHENFPTPNIPNRTNILTRYWKQKL